MSRNVKKIADMDDAAHEVQANVLLWMIGRSDDDQIEKFTSSPLLSTASLTAVERSMKLPSMMSSFFLLEFSYISQSK